MAGIHAYRRGWRIALPALALVTAAACGTTVPHASKRLSHGGVLGRKLVPVYHAIDATSADTIDSQLQAACDDFTQDHKIFVVFTGGNETFLQCMNSRGVASMEDDLTDSDAARFQRYPYYLEIGSMNLDRIAAIEVPGLQAQGHFWPWDSVAGA